MRTHVIGRLVLAMSLAGSLVWPVRMAAQTSQFPACVQPNATLGTTGGRVCSGTGSPEGALVGWIGDVYTRRNGGAGTSVYIKESGAGTDTGWVAVAGGVPVPATQGGTGQTVYAVGDLLYAATTTTLGKLADVATGQVLVSGGVGVAPAWSASPTVTNLTVSAGGELGIGTASPDAFFHISYASGTSFIQERSSVSAGENSYLSRKYRGAKDASGVVLANDTIFTFSAQGWNGAGGYGTFAYISADVDGNVGNNDYPGRLGFWTTPDAGSTTLERLRIANGGSVLLATTVVTSAGAGDLVLPNATGELRGVNAVIDKDQQWIDRDIDGEVDIETETGWTPGSETYISK